MAVLYFKSMNQDKTGLWLAAILVLLTVIILGVFVGFRGMSGLNDARPERPIFERPMPVEPDGGPGGVVCTMEAKQCPDGSFVGRSGPNCEFAACPGPSVQLEVNP